MRERNVLPADEKGRSLPPPKATPKLDDTVAPRRPEQTEPDQQCVYCKDLGRHRDYGICRMCGKGREMQRAADELLLRHQAVKAEWEKREKRKHEMPTLQETFPELAHMHKPQPVASAE